MRDTYDIDKFNVNDFLAVAARGRHSSVRRLRLSSSVVSDFRLDGVASDGVIWGSRPRI